jgi:hypothetical protein
VGSFEYDKKCFPSRITNLENSLLSNEIKRTIYNELNKDKYIYEVYAETASSFNELKESLMRRGYTDLPLQQFSIITGPNQTISEKSLITEKNVMLRRKSDQSRVT